MGAEKSGVGAVSIRRREAVGLGQGDIRTQAHLNNRDRASANCPVARERQCSGRSSRMEMSALGGSERKLSLPLLQNGTNAVVLMCAAMRSRPADQVRVRRVRLCRSRRAAVD
jgi:hypothetical protein